MGLWSSVTTWIGSKINPPKVTSTPVPAKTVPAPTTTYTPPAPTTSTPTTSTPTTTTSSGGGSSGGGTVVWTPSGLMSVDPVQAAKAPFKAAASPTRLSGGSSSSYQYTPIKEDDKKKEVLLTVQAAPTRTEQWKSAVQEKGVVSGSLWYAGQKTSGWFSSSQYSPVKDSGYQAPVGKLASTTVSTAPYFIPIVGSGLLIGSGGESIGTSAGRARISSSSEQLETKYNVPGYVSKPVQYSLALGQIYLGGKGLKISTEKAFNLPKSQVKLYGGSQKINKNTIVTQANYKMSTKTLFGTRTRYGTARTTTEFTQAKSGEYVLGKSTNWASSFNPSRLKLPGGTRVGDLKISQSFTTSFTKGSKITETVVTPTMKVSRNIKGFHTGFTGRGSYGTPKTIWTKPTKYKFVGKGGSYDVGEYTKVFGRSSLVSGEGKVLTQGRTEYEGLFKNIKTPEGSKIIFKQGTASKFSKNIFVDETQKLASGITTKFTPSTFTSKLFAPQQTSQVKVTTITPTTKLGVNSFTKQEFKSYVKVVNILKTDTSTKQKPKQRYGTVNTPAVTPTVIQTPAVTPTVIQTPTFKQPQKLKSPTRTPTPPPSVTFAPPIIGIPKFGLPLPGGINFPGMGKVRTKAKYGYTPSYTALAFGITGKKKAPTIGKRYTGLEFRPITKEYQNMFKSKWRFGKLPRIKLSM